MSRYRTLLVAGLVTAGLMGLTPAKADNAPLDGEHAGTFPPHDDNWHNAWHTQPYWRHPDYYKYHSVHQRSLGVHKGKTWKYLDGRHHGYPYTHSPYAPRANGATYTFGEWGPKRSYYHPYQPGGMFGSPYGYSPEPY